MEEFMKGRPERKAFPMDVQKSIIRKVKEFVTRDLLPNQNINRIILFGSLASGEFGKYEGSFQGRIYSDIDILLLVEDDFTVPVKWRIQHRGDLYSVYNVGELEGFLIQYMLCRRSSYEDPESQKEAEEWGVPLSKKSRHKHITIYSKRKGFLGLFR